MHTKTQTKSYPSLSSQQLSPVLRDAELPSAVLLALLCSLHLCIQDNISILALLLSCMQLCTEV